MNKVLPRAMKDFQFETRHVAREAARQQHKSLDAWLQDVIADYAADLGVDEYDLDRQQRIDAVALRLEGLSARGEDHRTDRDEVSSRFAGEPFDDRGEDWRADDLRPDDTELILEDAITVMQRRLPPDGRSPAGARQGARHGSTRVQAPRPYPFERHATRDVRHPAESQMAEDEAQAWARSDNTYWKFGNKLNEILDAVQSRSASAPASASDRRLGPAIADVRQRQQVLDGLGRAPQTPPDDKKHDSTQHMEARVSAAFAALQKKIAAQETTIDGLSRDVVGQREARSKLAGDLTTLCAEISTTLRNLRSRDKGPSAAPANEISCDTAAATAPDAPNQPASAPRSPKSDVGADAFVELQRQVEALSKQFERSQDNAAKLASIEGSVRNLFALQTAARTRQGEAESRTTLTFNAVHEAMGKIVERLSSMDKEMSEARHRPQETPPKTFGAASTGGVRSNLARDVAKAFADKPEAASPDRGAPQTVAPPRRPFPTRPVMVEAAPSPVSRSAVFGRSQAYVARQAKPVMAASGALLFVAGAAAAVYPGGISWHPIDTAAAVAPKHMAGASVIAPGPTRQADHRPSPALVSSLAAAPVETALSASFAAPSKQHQSASLARLRSLADAGNGAAQYQLGVQYSDTDIAPRDFVLAARWFQKAADQGIAPAQYRLGSLYEKGLGVPHDLSLAKSLYLKAAESGHPRAMHNLAVLLVDGNGHPDYEGAATWFRKAAQFGVHDSQYNLGILLGGGLGVSQSLVQSYAWFTIAAAQNDVEAAKKRDEVGHKLSSEDLATAKAWAASFQARTPVATAVQVRLPPDAETTVAKLVP